MSNLAKSDVWEVLGGLKGDDHYIHSSEGVYLHLNNFNDIKAMTKNTATVSVLCFSQLLLSSAAFDLFLHTV